MLCYKAHGDKCTESFYKDQVEDELRSQRAVGDERRHLEKIVAALNCLDGDVGLEDGDDAVDEEDAEEERLAQLLERAEAGELRIEDLTEEELRTFHSDLKLGALGHALGAWEPWWTRAAVVEVDFNSLDDDPGAPATSSAAPPAHICCVKDRKAHPSVALTVVEAAYAYAHTMRAFNGDWAWDPVQAALHFLHLASAVCSPKVYGSAAECIRAVLAAVAALPGGGFGAGLDLLCLADTATLLTRGVDSSARAVQEAAELLAAAGLVAEKEGRKSVGKLRRGVKKLEFLASFAAYHEDELAPLAIQIEAIERERRAELDAEAMARNRLAHDGIALPERG